MPDRIDSIPTVMTNGFTLNTPMPTPLISPTTAPTPSPAAIASAMAGTTPPRVGGENGRMTEATQTLTSASVEPTDMSTPRTSKVSICPMPTITR